MTPIPTKDQIRQWIAENPGLVAKRDIAKAFGIRGDAKIDLKRLLREMEEEGALEKKARRFREPGSLPPVAVLQVLAPDRQGDLFAVPLEEGVDSTLRILIVAQKGDPALGAGDRILGRLTPVKAEGHSHEARLIRRLGSNALKVLGPSTRARTRNGALRPMRQTARAMASWWRARQLATGALACRRPASLPGWAIRQVPGPSA